jgi:hypothetical protein
MHPIAAERGRFLPYLLAWVPLGVLLAALLALAGALAWTEALAVALPLTLLYADVCLGAFYVCRAVPLGPTHLGRLAATQLAAAVASAILWVLASRAWIFALDWLGLFPGLAAKEPRTVGVVVFGMGVLLFLLSSALHYVLAAVEASRRAETEALRLELVSREAELRALRAQIHPHFLFNALNSISALIGSDPAGARRMCILLAEFLRASLTLGTRDRVPLGEELALVEKLLAIEGVRFGSRLGREQLVEEDARPCLVPPLLLQPLVENAVTHGIAGLVDGGTVRIEARRRGSHLDVAVENPRDPETPARKGTGLGLDNVKRRLLAAYGREAGVTVREDRRRFRVELTLPAQAG